MLFLCFFVLNSRQPTNRNDQLPKPKRPQVYPLFTQLLICIPLTVTSEITFAIHKIMKKLAYRLKRRFSATLVGMSLTVDFSGDVAKRLFPDSFGDGPSTIRLAFREAGNSLRKAMGSNLL